MFYKNDSIDAAAEYKKDPRAWYKGVFSIIDNKDDENFMVTDPDGDFFQNFPQEKSFKKKKWI